MSLITTDPLESKSGYLKNFKLFIVIFSFSLLIFNSAVAEAATYYSSSSGSGTTCTFTAPCSISAGISKLAGGDTLYLRAGTYASQDYLFDGVPSGNSWSSPTTISNYNNETVTITAAPADHTVHFGTNGQSYIVLNGVIVDGSCSGCDGAKIDNGAHHIRLSNIEIKNFSKQGVLMPAVPDAPLTGFNEIINCHIHNGGTRPEYDHGLYISVSDVLVEGCIIHDTTGFGIQKYDEGDRITVRNNIIYNEMYACIGLMSNNIGHKVYNNITGPNCGWNAGIAAVYGSHDSDVYNNTVINGGIYIYDAGAGYNFDNNLLYNGNFNIESATGQFNVRNNLATSYGGADSGKGVLQNNLFGSQYDPKLANPGGGDIRLLSGSPAIDKGRTISGLTKDFEGTSRPQGSAYDIGADEFGTGSVPSTLPGDINGDRIVNSLDWSLMSAKWLTSDTSADLNKDGAVNSLDWSIMSNNWLKAI